MTEFWLRVLYPLISTGAAFLMLLIPIVFLELWVERVKPGWVVVYLLSVPVIQLAGFVLIGWRGGQ